MSASTRSDSSPATRRGFLKTAGVALTGAGVIAAGYYSARALDTVKSKGPQNRLVRPLISADRVLGVTVGISGQRNTGFVVRSESLGTKTIVHHYGHGGAGWTLSWGTSALA